MFARLFVLALPTVIAGGMAIPAQPATAVPAAPNRTAARAAPDAEASALAQAKISGHRVEVLDRRDEKGSLFANPDGTLTSERSVQPTRVRRGDQWVPVDPNLRRDATGAI